MAKGKKKAARKAKRAAKRAAKAEKRLTKRQKAARKAARTRKANAAKRSKAAKKAARARKRGPGKRKSKRGKSKRASEPKKGKKKGSKKGGKRKGNRESRLVSQLGSAKANLANIDARYGEKRAKLIEKLEKAHGAERQRLMNRIGKLEQEKNAEIVRVQARSAKLHAEVEQLRAAEEDRKKRSRKAKRARENPVGSGGMHEYLTAGAGILTGLALTIIPYRLVRSHALTPAPVAGGNADAPAQGDVPNLLTAQLPLWSRLKWRGLVALGVVVVGDIAVPLFIASRIKTSDGWKTYFQMWGWTGVTLGTGKVLVDVLALATKSTKTGQRLFAPENTARDVRTQSAAAQLPPIGVGPGVGMPGLTGYGKAAPGCAHVGAGAPCCAACADSASKGKNVPPGGPPGPSVPPPVKGTTPMPAAPGVPAAPPLDQVPPGGAQPALPGQSLTNGGPRSAAGAAGAPENRFAPKNRFDSRRLRAV